MYGSCEDSLLALNPFQSIQPSPPAQFKNGNWILIEIVLQLDVNGLDHSYDV
jgi:hypothetical protein